MKKVIISAGLVSLLFIPQFVSADKPSWANEGNSEWGKERKDRDKEIDKWGKEYESEKKKFKDK